jgi:hypothetical protein
MVLTREAENVPYYVVQKCLGRVLQQVLCFGAGKPFIEPSRVVCGSTGVIFLAILAQKVTVPTVMAGATVKQ